MFSQVVIEAAKKHAIGAFPNEAVGFVGSGEYRPQENISLNKLTGFEVRVGDTLAAGKIEAVIHSHPGGELFPSKGDMEQQMVMAVPWGIVVCDSERCSDPTWFGDQAPYPPLWGPERIFRHGVTDCYSLVRHYYHQTYGFWLKDFPRDWEWWLNQDSPNLYETFFEVAGFREITVGQLRPGDGFLASAGREAIRGGLSNHGGIYLGGSSGDMILHHLSGASAVDHTRIALRQPGAGYLKYVNKFVRHKDV